MNEIINSLFFIATAFARGGGGGSSGGGGGGGGFSGGSMSSSSGASGGNAGGSIIPVIIFFAIFALIMYLKWRQKKQKIEKAQQVLSVAENKDAMWQEDAVMTRVRDVFMRFQQDWSNFDIEKMKEYLSEEYLKRMTLELSVLKNEGRKNIMENVSLNSAVIMEAVDAENNNQDKITVEISASAKDTLFDVKSDKSLYTDNSPFVEYWTFARENDVWKLDIIKQATEDKAMGESQIAEFAEKNNFYYDADFGWLMMPNKGVIFRKTNFQNSDINNHVIGYFREKIVEFYTYIPNPQNNKSLETNYIVAQAIIPKQYNDILVRKKRKLFNFGPFGLRRVQTESNDFERKFCIWADAKDQATSFELLTPNFMEKIYALPYELNIEVVGNVLYFYAKSRQDINYDSMLEILSWAFDEMKM